MLRELLSGMAALRPEWQWHVVVNNQAWDRLPTLANTEYVRYSRVDQSGWRVRLWYETALPLLLRRLGADLLFSHTNYLQLGYRPCKSLLLIQHAGHFSPLFRQLIEARSSGWLTRLTWRLKSLWVRASVKRADCVTVQTRALAERVREQTGVHSDCVRVIAHGLGQIALQREAGSAKAVGRILRVGYITLPGVQKNFSVLFRAAALLKAAGTNITLVMTLSPHLPESEEVFDLARELDVLDLIENHGVLAAVELADLYLSLDVFVFPSLCESFGFPMVEAMASGIPLLVADTDTNVEVAGAGGVVFPAHDAEALAREILRMTEEPDWYQQRTQASLRRAGELTWRDAAAQTVDLMEEMLSAKKS